MYVGGGGWCWLHEHLEAEITETSIAPIHTEVVTFLELPSCSLHGGYSQGSNHSWCRNPEATHGGSVLE